MNETKASQTALGVSLMRAIHTRLDHPQHIDDPWGDRLVLDSERAAFGSEARLRRSPGYGLVILRTRYTEETLAAAVARGVRQYVILGAGMDSFALRQPAFAQGVDVIEVDHPASQTLKRERLRACGARVPPRLHFVPADLSREPLATALTRSPYRSVEPAFFSWLGVAVYLAREANLATLRGIAAGAAAGSELVFTYMDQRDMDAESDSIRDLRSRVAALGEPWVSGFDPTQLGDDLRQVGLSLVEDFNGEEIWRKYCTGDEDGLRSPAVFRIARARVA
ncbi:MAG: class I SAM-dependent methyltransferase [Deltaproteobacteria bacterium]|nr:class I SAM-dependent methyltransferase [Deltaproteobacteria bacterium]